MPTSFEFTIELIEQDIGQQRTQRSALWHSLHRFFKPSARQDHSRLQELGDQSEKPPVAHAFAQALQQLAVIHRVEELLQIAIHHLAPWSALVAFPLQLLDGLLGTTARSESIRVVAEGRWF